MLTRARRKKICALLLLVIILASLAGCKSDRKNDLGNEEPKGTAEATSAVQLSLTATPTPAHSPTFIPRDMSAYTVYLEENAEVFSGDNIAEKFDFADTEIFFVGEQHFVAENYAVHLDLIKTLNEEYGVRDICLEISYSYGEMINNYVNGGDVQFFEGIFETMKVNGSAFAQMERYNFYNALREYQESLPEDRKLRIYGIDVEMTGTAWLIYALSLLPANPPSQIEDIITLFYDTNQISAIDFMAMLRSSLDTHKIVYMEYLDENYDNFVSAFENLEAYVKWHGIGNRSMAGNEFRETYIIDNIKEIYESGNGNAPFCIMGNYHVELTDRPLTGIDYTTASYFANEYAPTKDRVVSIYSWYYGRGETFESPSYAWGDALVDYLPESWEEIMFCKLNEKGSPFLDHIRLNKYQYVLVFPKSTSTTLFVGD